MKNSREVIDPAISDIPLTSADLGTLAVAEFSIYFQDLPKFEPTEPMERPILDTHVGTWVEENNQKFGHALMWRTRAQEKKPDLFQVDGTLIKTIRDQDDLRTLGQPKRFQVFSNVSTPVMGERLSHDLDDEELKMVQHIVRKNQKYKRETNVPVDKFVIAALIESIDRPTVRRHRKPRAR